MCVWRGGGSGGGESIGGGGGGADWRRRGDAQRGDDRRHWRRRRSRRRKRRHGGGRSQQSPLVCVCRLRVARVCRQVGGSRGGREWQLVGRRLRGGGDGERRGPRRAGRRASEGSTPAESGPCVVHLRSCVSRVVSLDVVLCGLLSLLPGRGRRVGRPAWSGAMGGEAVGPESRQRSVGGREEACRCGKKGFTHFRDGTEQQRAQDERARKRMHAHDKHS